MKYCNSCRKKKDIIDFGKRTASSDGLSHKCKVCQQKYDKARANLPHRVKARTMYAKTPKGRLAHNKAKKKWQKSNIIKRSAHILVGNAVRDGKLKKPNKCEVCDIDKSLYGHHDDYAKPLNVRWLCSACHSQWHTKHGEAKNP